MNIRQASIIALVIAICPPTVFGIAVSTNSLDFGAQLMSTTKTTTLTLINTEPTRQAKLTGFSISNPVFARASSNCPEYLPPAGTCTYTLTFTPTQIGSISGRIQVYSWTGNQIINLSGYGTSLPPTKLGPKKWHPGHYIQIAPPRKLSNLKSVYNIPEFSGVLRSYYWSELETSKDVYDFSKIQADLLYLKATGKRLGITVIDKTFSSSSIQCVPNYMLTEAAYLGGQVINSDSGGCIAKRWLPSVMDRFIALHKAIGAKYDEEPYLEFISTTETSNSMPLTDGATTRQYVDQIKRLSSAMKLAYPKTVASIWVNYGVSPYTHELVEHLYQNGIGMGGPDTSPLIKTQTIPEYTSLYGDNMPFVMGVQMSQLLFKDNPIVDGRLTWDQLFDYLVNDPNGINATHAVWGYFNQQATAAVPYDFGDIIDLISSRGGDINTGCPANLICSTD